MNIIDLQKFLFEHNPSRLELVDYVSSTAYTTYTVSVYRNHSFELIEHTIKAYLDYAQLAIRFEYSNYDDTLSFSHLNTSADLILLWIDLSRYQQVEDIYDFIEQRLRYLRSAFEGNILVALLNGENYVFTIPDIYMIELHEIKVKFGEKYLDERLESFSGTKLSSLALMEISKMLALKYFPSLLRSSIKAIIVDLDNTLYQGVLGEDGIDGIILTNNHRILQQFLLELSKKGFILLCVSKNNHDDVKRMFNTRNDFPLKWDTFTKIYASWDLKSQMIREIKEYLNINEDSMVFIDDNAGEIIEVMSIFPNIKVIHAALNPEITYRVLQNFPGIFRFSNHIEDSLRKSDIRANETRHELQQTLPHEEYIKTLNMVLTYKINNQNDIPRIVELSNKTNQFIFSYKRYKNTQISDLMKDKMTVVISICLKDKLSDSGLIGACVFNKTDKAATLDELFISCRALGRGIEKIMIFSAIKFALDRLNTVLLKINFTKGERNTPAELFVNQYLTSYLHKDDNFNFQNDQNLLEICLEG
jgi:FkbH-like protein